MVILINVETKTIARTFVIESSSNGTSNRNDNIDGNDDNNRLQPHY